MSSILLQNTIIPIQITLHDHCSHALPQTIIPIQLTLLACIIAHMSFSIAAVLTIAVKVLGMHQHTNPLSLNWSWYWEFERLLFSLAVKIPNFWGPKIDKKVINFSTKCLISVKIAILTAHIIPPPLVNIWLIFDLQKYVKWLCMFLEVNPCFKRAHLLYGLQPAADPYSVVCSVRQR